MYAFFVQWKPELYGDEEEISAERRGFVVLEDDDKEDSEEMEVFEEYFNNGVTALQKDWEVQNGGINAVQSLNCFICITNFLLFYMFFLIELLKFLHTSSFCMF